MHGIVHVVHIHYIVSMLLQVVEVEAEPNPELSESPQDFHQTTESEIDNTADADIMNKEILAALEAENWS